MVRKIAEMSNIYYVRQKEPRGLGHAILKAEQFIGNEPFAVLLGDDVVVSQKPCIGQLMERFDEKQATVLGVQTVAKENVDKYGIIAGPQVADRLYRVEDMVEKPAVEDAPSNVAVLGRYVITPEIFGYLKTQEAGKGNEIQLTDALKRMAADQEMYAYDFKGKRYDVGSKIGFLEANVEFALRTPGLKEEMLEYLASLHADMDRMLQYD